MWILNANLLYFYAIRINGKFALVINCLQCHEKGFSIFRNIYGRINIDVKRSLMVVHFLSIDVTPSAENCKRQQKHMYPL